MTRPNTLERRITDLESAVRSLMSGDRSRRASVDTTLGPVTLTESAQAAIDAQAVAADAAAAVASATDAATTATGQAAAALTAAQDAAAAGTSAHDAAVAAQTAADAAQAAADTAGTSAAQGIADAAQALANAAAAIDQAQAAQTAADAAQAAASAASGVAASAVTLATGKVTYITGTTAPAWTGAADSAVWIEVLAGTAGRVLHNWDGTTWGTVPWGTPAIATGAITADLVSATAIDGKTITGALVRTADPAVTPQRVALGNSVGGLSAYNSAGVAVTTISNVDGSITTTKGTITGATVQTAASGTRLMMDSTNGLRGFTGTATTPTTQLTTGGVLSATGATISGTLRTAATGPRIEMLQNAAGALGASGALNFYSGLSGAAPAGLTNQVNYTDQGGGLVTMQGSTFTVDGGDSNVPGPYLELNVEEDPAGGYMNVTRLYSNQVGATGHGQFITNAWTITPTIRVTSTADVGPPTSVGGAVSTGHPFQIGSDTGQRWLMDNNEAASVTVDTNGNNVLGSWGISASSVGINPNLSGVADLRLNGTQGSLASNAVRKDYVDVRAVQVADTAWRNVTFQNGWTNYGVTGYPGCKYRITGTGEVIMEGMMSGGTIGAGVIAFALASGFRPGAQLTFGSVGNNAIARIDVLINGGVCVVVGSSAAWTSISGVRFFAV